MKNNNYLEVYTDTFRYKEVKYVGQKFNKMYLKQIKEGFIVIESLRDSKYANFYLNQKRKVFKKSDLLLCALERIPAAWEAENE